MSAFRIQFPVTDAVRVYLDSSAALARLVGNLELRDKRQIVRILGNLHYDHLEKLTAFLEVAALRWPALVKDICDQTSEFQFRRKLAELYLVHWLDSKSGISAYPATAVKAEKHHDVEAMFGNVLAKIEVYTRTDFIGLQSLELTVLQIFKYLDVPRGFRVDLLLTPTSPGDVVYAYGVGEEGEIHAWFSQIEKSAMGLLSDRARIGDKISMLGPRGNIRLDAEIIAVNEDATNRLVTYSSATRSTDSRLFFDMGEPSVIADGQWGKQVLNKMRNAQCGASADGVLRVLAVNFAEMETSDPHFFLWSRANIKDRIVSAISLIEQKATDTYDAILLCDLAINNAVGLLVVFDHEKRALAHEFGAKCGVSIEVLRSSSNQVSGA